MRLTDADTLEESMNMAIEDTPLYIQATVAQYIDCAPTIDPIHAAGGCYCRECVKFSRYTKTDPNFGICKRHNSEVGENDFCSYGKPEEAQDDRL